MPLNLLPTFILTMLVVGYTPGPANIYSLSCSLAAGRKAAMRAWFGLLAGFSVAALLSATAVHFVGMAVGRWIGYVKYIGAAYMLYLAYKTWKSSIADTVDSSSCTFWDGFLVQFTNAKMILFELTAYSSFVLPYSDRLSDLFVVCALLLIAGPVANLVWLLLGSSIRPFIIRYQHTIGIILALALVACSIIVAIG